MMKDYVNSLINKDYQYLILNSFTYGDWLALGKHLMFYVYIIKYIINSFKERLSLDSYHIKTGFTGTPLILLTLFDNNMDEYAYRIILLIIMPMD